MTSLIVLIQIMSCFILLQKDGVLEVGNRDRYEGTVRIISRQCEQPAGTLADFTIFFLGMYD